jgi:hypothetical protein
MARVSSLLTVYYNGEDFFLEMNQSETRIACGGLYKGLSIDASYQASVHLANWFRRRRFF